jgi:hypothetical protein
LPDERVTPSGLIEVTAAPVMISTPHSANACSIEFIPI